MTKRVCVLQSGVYLQLHLQLLLLSASLAVSQLVEIQPEDAGQLFTNLTVTDLHAEYLDS